MKNIKNIIFDLGGIFIDIDYTATENAFIRLGVTNFGELFSQHDASTIFKDLETGRLSPEQFYETFRRETGFSLSDEQIRDAWNAMLGSFSKEKIEWLKKIKDKYRIFLFSNTNKIHYDAFQEIFRKEIGDESFDDIFIKAYYSHDLGLRKPDTRSFQELMQLENLDADETLFIDDTIGNIEGAKLAGLHTILLQHPQTVLDLDL